MTIWRANRSAAASALVKALFRSHLRGLPLVAPSMALKMSFAIGRLSASARPGFRCDCLLIVTNNDNA